MTYPDTELGPQIRPLGETFNGFELLRQEAAPNPEPDYPTDWILLAVDRQGEPLVLDAADGFYRYELLTELYACDNGIYHEKGLKPGLYKMTACRVVPDSYGDPEISGKWERLA